MLKNKLHNPIIANNSFLENAVIERTTSILESQSIIDIDNNLIPDEGRIWFNTDTGIFRFSNNTSVGHVDEFLSKTNTRKQDIISKLDIYDDVSIIGPNELKLISFKTDINTIDVLATNINFDKLSLLKITNSDDDIKVVIDTDVDSLLFDFNNTTIQGDTTIDGNMVVIGDLTVGGKATKIDVQSENLSIADNIITLNSNLTTEDPRLASTIVEGEDVDKNAGIAINRGSEGILDWMKWIESTDTSTSETLKEGKTSVAIWNYESTTPKYEMHQIIDAYTLARTNQNISGTSWIGYHGYTGSNVNSGYGFGIDPAPLDQTLNLIVSEIDNNKYNDIAKSRIGETPSSGKKFTIKHNLNTTFLDVQIQGNENGHWNYDSFPIEVIDENTIVVESTEDIKIRFMITAIAGLDVSEDNITIE